MISDEEVMKYIEKQEKKLRNQDIIISVSLVVMLFIFCLAVICIGGEHGIIPSAVVVLVSVYFTLFTYFDNKGV